VRQKFASRKDSALYVYPQADHGFNCGDRASYNARASALAHGRTLTFLGEHL
jgi:carboxymethylenebutenolidase